MKIKKSTYNQEYCQFVDKKCLNNVWKTFSILKYYPTTNNKNSDNNNNDIENNNMKDKLKKEYYRRVRKEFGNSAAFLGCSRLQLEEINWRTRKLLTMHNGFHPKSNVERLYLSRSEGSRGLIGV